MLLHKSHKLTEALFKGGGKRGSHNRILVAFVKVVGKSSHFRPIRIGKVIITIDTTIQMTTFPMKTKAVTQLLRSPNIHITGIDQ